MEQTLLRISVGFTHSAEIGTKRRAEPAVTHPTNMAFRIASQTHNGRDRRARTQHEASLKRAGLVLLVAFRGT